jgi:hypothetical protein
MIKQLLSAGDYACKKFESFGAGLAEVCGVSWSMSQLFAGAESQAMIWLYERDNEDDGVPNTPSAWAYVIAHAGGNWDEPHAIHYEAGGDRFLYVTIARKNIVGWEKLPSGEWMFFLAPGPGEPLPPTSEFGKKLARLGFESSRVWQGGRFRPESTLKATLVSEGWKIYQPKKAKAA